MTQEADWHDITRIGSAYAEEVSPSTNKRRHRPMAFPGFGKRDAWAERGTGEWIPGPAPDNQTA